MKDLILERKTGFASSMPFQIYDINGILFYSDTFTDHIALGHKVKFNLPLGVYKYDGNFVRLEMPVAMSNIPLPLKERNLGHKRYEIIFGENPNKCTIFYDRGIILFDNQFLRKPLYVKYVIYFHELGHHWYNSEEKADLYAAKKLLELGFNPSQIGRGVLDALDGNKEESFERMEKIVAALTKNNS
jgi:hypothetical protein